MPGLLEGSNETIGMAQESVAGLGQVCAPFPSPEQKNAQTAFQSLDTGADRRLRDVQTQGRRTEISGRRYGKKGTCEFDIHTYLNPWFTPHRVAGTLVDSCSEIDEGLADAAQGIAETAEVGKHTAEIDAFLAQTALPRHTVWKLPTRPGRPARVARPSPVSVARY